MAITVRLTPDELAEIAFNAKGRNDIKVEKHIATKKISDRLTDGELHELEVRGQYAVSRYLKVPMDWSITVGGNKGPHFRVNNISLRVQTATHHPPLLKLNRMEDFTTDLMVLCLPWEPDVLAIYGCVSRQRFKREHRPQDFGHGKRLVMQSWYLTPIEDYQIEALA